MIGVGRLNRSSPVNGFQHPDAIGQVSNERIGTPRYELSFAGMGRVERDKLGMLQPLAHERFMKRASRYGHHIAWLVEVAPAAYGAVVAGGDGEYIAHQMRFGEA